MSDYRCPKGSCTQTLIEKQFGTNKGYFCSTHGLVRVEIFPPKEMPKPVEEPPTEESPNEETQTEETSVEETQVEKPKRTRKAKAVKDSQ